MPAAEGINRHRLIALAAVSNDIDRGERSPADLGETGSAMPGPVDHLKRSRKIRPRKAALEC
jgi:hypothetical protein